MIYFFSLHSRTTLDNSASRRAMLFRMLWVQVLTVRSSLPLKLTNSVVLSK